jgi:hypothetical protein
MHGEKNIKPRYFMMLRKETMTEEMGWRLAVAFPLLSAFTIVLSASFNILLPIANVASSLSVEQERPFRRAWQQLPVGRNVWLYRFRVYELGSDFRWGWDSEKTGRVRRLLGQDFGWVFSVRISAIC